MTSNDEDEILRAERRRCAALAVLDMDALDRLFADDLVHVHSNAMVHDKSTLMRHIQAKGTGIRVERGPLELRVIGSAAVLVGSCTNHPPPHEPAGAPLSGMVTQVLRKEATGWRFVSFQFTAAAR